VVSRIELKFGKVLSPTEFIHKVIYDGNEIFFLHGNFFKVMKIRKNAPSGFILEGHDNGGIIAVAIGMDNTCFSQFLENYLYFIFFEQIDDDKGEH
jgi:hypothetical protein